MSWIKDGEDNLWHKAVGGINRFPVNGPAEARCVCRKSVIVNADTFCSKDPPGETWRVCPTRIKIRNDRLYWLSREVEKWS